jgi:hypothetical protein
LLSRFPEKKLILSFFLCFFPLNLFRSIYVTEVLKSSSQEVYDLEKERAKSLEEEELLSRKSNKEFEGRLTRGERLADRLADFGGSWTFIGIFMTILAIWMAINTWILLEKPFDPYPYLSFSSSAALSGGAGVGSLSPIALSNPGSEGQVCQNF